jgi:hypothetical protein
VSNYQNFQLSGSSTEVVHSLLTAAASAIQLCGATHVHAYAELCRNAFNDSLLMAMLKGLSQLLHVIEQFTGMPGRYVRIRNTLLEFSEILGGTNDPFPEQAFFV